MAVAVCVATPSASMGCGCIAPVVAQCVCSGPCGSSCPGHLGDWRVVFRAIACVMCSLELAGHGWQPVPFLLHSRLTLGEGVEAFHERAFNGGSIGRIPATQAMLLALAHAGKLAKFGP